MMGLISAGFLASALTPTPQVATADQDSAALIREGKQLYDTSCVTCHGVNLQGVQDRGPSLIGVGEAFRKVNPNVRLFAMEPSESRTILCGEVALHQIEGISDGFVPGIFAHTANW